ncbi:MAG: sensor histidine kinase [Lachnospiraceae bacterium]|nr:sensor histidine kinase [Lachnospiraceae bacterium]
MNQLKAWFLKQKLNIKFTLVIGVLVFIPMGIICFMFYYNEQKTVVQQQIYSIRSDMQHNYGEVQKTVEMCNMTTQTFLNNKDLEHMLIRLKKNEAITTSEYVEFNAEDITTLERLVNSNPYLYQTRVYAKNDRFPEMMPILYREERLKDLVWAENYQSGKWQFDYQDLIFPEATMNSSSHAMALVTKIKDYEAGDIGTIEVAVRMDNIFPDIFAVDENAWSCYMDEEGNVYSNEADPQECKWVTYQNTIFDRLSSQMKGEEAACFSATLGGEKVILGYMPVPELGGCMISLHSLKPQLSQMSTQRNILLGGMLFLYMIVVFIINTLVKAILKQFYMTLTTMRQVQKGDLSVRIRHCSEDEMGELGMQFNVMLDSIQRLMEENINREVLAKNSEIRALQNQINSHFIYNVLESIKMMAEIDEKYEISDAVTSLGKLLRYSMKWTSPVVSVEDEIDYIVNYLDLINLRFDYRIQLSLNIPEQIYKSQIPKMSLQPIIENAIVHGIEELAEDATIYIKAEIAGEELKISVTDSGKGMTPEEVETLEKKIEGRMEVSGGSGHGIGLKNVQDRINMSFGSQYGLKVISKKDCYTKVTMTVPKNVEEHKA